MPWGRILEVGGTLWWFWGQANLSLSPAVPLKTLLTDLEQVACVLVSFKILEIEHLSHRRL